MLINFMLLCPAAMVLCMLLCNTVWACDTLVPYARKAAPGCSKITAGLQQVYPLLVTSLGGAGTHHITCMMSALNIQVGHETIERDGAVGWQYAVNDSFVGMDYPHHAALSRLNALFVRVLHVTRCPMLQISAVTSHLRGTYEFLLRSMRVLDFAGLPSGTAAHFREYGLSVPRSACCDAAGCDAAADAADADAPSGTDEAVWSRRAPSYPPRGSPCWLRFSAAAWLFWHRLIDRVTSERFRIEDQAAELLVAACEAAMAGMGGVGGSGSGVRRGRSAATCDAGALEKMQSYIKAYRNGVRGAVAQGFEQCGAVAKPAVLHRRHRRYTYDQLRAVDAPLAEEIQKLGMGYGYNATCSE